jgi:hypothetical protein
MIATIISMVKVIQHNVESIPMMAAHLRGSHWRTDDPYPKAIAMSNFISVISNWPRNYCCAVVACTSSDIERLLSGGRLSPLWAGV